MDEIVKCILNMTYYSILICSIVCYVYVSLLISSNTYRVIFELIFANLGQTYCELLCCVQWLHTTTDLWLEQLS